MPLYPRHRARRALAVAACLRRLVPPRVVAVVIRTWYDGRCTQRRFQTRGSRCLFGRGSGEDSVQHYMRCPELHSSDVKGLRLPPREGVAEQSLAFLLLEPASELPDVTLTLRALLVATT